MKRILGAVCTAVLCCGAIALAADTLTQEAGEAWMKTHAKVLIDNERVKVYENWTTPGEKGPIWTMHDYVVYNLSDYTVKLTYEDGTTVDIMGKAGTANFVPGKPHWVENTGKTDERIVIIEIKHKK
jgi:hypothetical protein